MIAFFCVFLAGISLSPLHWHRWTIPLLPVVALFGARGILLVADNFHVWYQGKPQRRVFIEVLMVAVLTAVPSYELAMFQLQERDGGIRREARSWILENIPAGSRIASEYYSAPISDTSLDVRVRPSLAEGRSIDDYRVRGFDYLMTSSAVTERYGTAGTQYEHERRFYKRLEQELLPMWEGRWTPPTLLPGRAIPDMNCPCNLWPVEGPLVIKIFAVAPSDSAPGGNR
jgi:hypothetical protein